MFASILLFAFHSQGATATDAAFPRDAETVVVRYLGGANGMDADRSATTITRVRCTSTAPAEALFLVDASESIGAGTFHRVKKLLADIVAELGGGDAANFNVNVALATFNHEQHVEAELGTLATGSDVVAAIKSMAYRGGGTFTGAALAFAARHIFGNGDDGRHRTAFIVTDGSSHDDVVAPAAQLRALGVDVFVVAVGYTPDVGVVNEIASNPDARFTAFVSAHDFVAPINVANSVSTQICATTDTATSVRVAGRDEGAVVPRVDPTVPGVYTIKYTATAASGVASAPVYRTVTVADTERPSLTLPQVDLIEVEAMSPSAGDSLPAAAPWGATVSDNCVDETPVLRFVAESEAPHLGEDTDVLWCGRGYARSLQHAARATQSQSFAPLAEACGRYAVTYIATDAAGNVASATRSIHVRDTVGPITAVGATARSVAPIVDISSTKPDKGVQCQALGDFDGAYALTYSHGLTATYVIDGQGMVTARDSYFAGNLAIMACVTTGNYSGFYRIDGLHRPGKTYEYLRLTHASGAGAAGQPSLEVRHFAIDSRKRTDPITGARHFCCTATGGSACGPLSALTGVHTTAVGGETYTVTASGFVTASGANFVSMVPTPLLCEVSGAHAGTFRANFSSPRFRSLQHISLAADASTLVVTEEATWHAPRDLEGESCDSYWTDCHGCTSSGGFCGTPSGALGEVGGHASVVVCGDASCGATAAI